MLMVNTGKELMQINTFKNTIEYSTTQGSFWIPRFTSNGYGDLNSFPENGKELLATTTKGLCTFINSADVGLKDDKKGNVEAQEVGENYNIYDKKTEF